MEVLKKLKELQFRNNIRGYKLQIAVMNLKNKNELAASTKQN